MKRKYLTVILTCVLMLTGCGSTIEKVEETSDPLSEAVGSLITEVVKDSIESAVGSKEVSDVEPVTEKEIPDKENSLADKLLFGAPEFELGDVFEIRECDNEWELPIHWKSLCENSGIFWDEVPPSETTITLSEYKGESFIVGFTDEAGYLAVPGDFYVGKETNYEAIKQVYEGLSEIANGVYIVGWDDSYGEKNILQFELDSSGIIKRILYSIVPERDIDKDSASFVPYKYMAVTNE